jgi:pimeloyl-ACP methyl ester carboxylesterase
MLPAQPAHATVIAGTLLFLFSGQERHAIERSCCAWCYFWKELVMSSDAPWVDPSPHRSAFITVNGLQAHLLDWGGTGAPVLLLPGFGNTAHIFDDFAPRLTDQYHIRALTRRGHGQSDLPAAAYDTMTLVEDIHQTLDHLQIAQVHLIGHSMAGAEMTCLASAYPQRIASVVYLDAAYDFTTVQSAWQGDPVPPPPPPSEHDRASFAALAAYYRQQFGFWTSAQEADLRAVYEWGPDGLLRFRMSQSVSQALRAGYEAIRPTYSQLQCPSLAIYAVYDRYPWLPADAEATLREQAQAFLDQSVKAWQRQEMARFQQECPDGQTLELPGANHFCFIDRREVVVSAIKHFWQHTSPR